MIPIGVLTRNRAHALSITLRSLKASEIPKGVQVVVYDHSSDDPLAVQFLYGLREVELETKWPSDLKALGLDFLREREAVPSLRGRQHVVPIGAGRAGHLGAARAAFNDLFARFPDAPAAILVEDDLVFKEDWYEQMTAEFLGGGYDLVSGFHLDKRGDASVPRIPSIVTETTSQCLLLSRGLRDRMASWFCAGYLPYKAFDIHLCEQARKHVKGVRLISPFVCQHIGLDSVYDSTRSYAESGVLRVGVRSEPPYAWPE